ncbi:MAG: hypothetical protein LQ338_001348 [Usnochroma carphineum]|nr:MAG: hypothetical protein LQ338_001348 [Usnochroma carphineum]
MSLRPLFIASIGNPPPAYTNTLHSAGHTVLNSLRTWLLNPPFTKSRPHASGLLSASPDFTLWQSPALMNISGKPVATAWRTFLFSLSSPEDKKAARLVVVHDELELPIGKIKVRDGGTSTRGHNGLKSVMQALGGGMEFTRVGVGIGRPVTPYAHGNGASAEAAGNLSKGKISLTSLIKSRGLVVIISLAMLERRF